MPQQTFTRLALAIAVGWSTMQPGLLLAEEREKAPPPIAGKSFYTEKERGWFWYEDPPPEPEEKPEPKPDPLTPAPPPAPEPPKEELPPPGTAAWIRIMLPKLRDAAIDNPTRENIAAYYYAQRLMLDKAEIFSRRSMEVIRNDPFLDEDMRYPASNAASGEIATAAGRRRDELMARIAEKAALLFFYNGANCVLCTQAISALNGLEYKYKMKVIPISMDGNKLPDPKYHNTQYDTGLAKHLGIIASPSLAIAIPPNDVRIVAFSTISMETTVSRILTVARDVGLITEAEYQGTSHLNTMGLIEADQALDIPENPVEDTEAFVNRMREEAKRAFLKDNGGNEK